MKKNLNYLLSALGLSAAAVFTLSGCRDYDVMDEEKAKDVSKRQEFYDNFVKEFGQPDPNHTWGWGLTPEMADAILANSGATTRAEEDPYSKSGIVNTNRNQWCTASDAYSLMNIYGVPGWPNDDGRYYEKSGEYTDGHYIMHNTKPSSCNMPNGDLTEYEILWVSNYIHTQGAALANNTKQLHISDYYIQPVSCDDDYATQEDYWNGNPKVYAKTYTECKMDKIESKSLVGNDTWTHINNNNWGINRKPIQNAINNSGRNIIYVQSAGTEDFRYHASNSTTACFYKFVLVEVTWTEPVNPDWSKIKTEGVVDKEKLKQALANASMLDNNTIQRTGYYICFDYEDAKTGESFTYGGDDVYDNWILKLTPSIPVPKERWPKRIMCEDLGNTYDFDFNDAVFDLSFAQNTDDHNWYDMLVVVQAAGGTIPAYVAINPSEYSGNNMEIHHLLGNEAITPVNVIRGGKTSAPAMYRVKKAFQHSYSEFTDKDFGDGAGSRKDYTPSTSLLAQMAASAFKMKIYVQNNTGGYEKVSGYDLQKGLRADNPNGYNNGEKAGNSFPQLFNCSAEAKWTIENGHIGKAYTYFKNWVADEQCQYRLRWDEKEYFQRADEYKKTHPDYVIDPNMPLVLVEHDASTISSWIGSWDYGPNNSGSTSGWINTSLLW